MLLICSISNEIPEVPVLNRFSGHAYERRLIDEYLTTSDLNPVTGVQFSRDELVEIRVLMPSFTSIPALLKSFQDALMLQQFIMKQENQALKCELSHALYQYDVSCRVVTHLAKEATTAREALSTLKSQVGIMSHIVSSQAAQFDKSEAGKTLRWVDMLNATVPSRIKTALDKIPANVQECAMDEYHNFLFDGLVSGYSMTALGSGHNEQLIGKTCVNPNASILIPNQNLLIGDLPRLRYLCILAGLINKLVKKMMEFTNNKEKCSRWSAKFIQN